MNRFTLPLLGFVSLLTVSCAAQQIPMPFFHAVDTATAVKTLPNLSPEIGYNLLRVKDSTMLFYQYSWHEYVTKAAGAKGHVWIRNVGPGIFNIGPQDTLFIKGSGVTFTKTGTDTLLMTVAAGSGDITDVGPMYASGAAGTDGVTTSGTTWFTIEGVTNNAFETNLILASADPSADINLTFPSATSTIVGHTSSVLDVAGLGLSVSGTTLVFDATELGNLTFGPGTDGSVVYNWNLTAGDPQLTLGNGVFNISSGTLQQGGTAVVLQSRTVSTTSPLAGGGALSGDLTLSITANGIGPTQIDETANYTWTGKHDYTGAEILGASALRFEGATDDNIYTIFAFTDPTTSNKTITFPNASGTVAISATSPITLSATGAIGLTQNGGTDVTADLEEETHVSEHADGGADELAVTGLSGLLADVQKVGVRKNSTGTVFTRQQVNFIEGSGINVTIVDDAGTPETDVTIAASGASTLWDAIGDPSGDGDVAMVNTAQTLTWDTPSTATALDALTLKWNYDATAGDVATNLLTLERSATVTGSQVLTSLLRLNNADDQTVALGVWVTAVGEISTAFKADDADIVVALDIGDNDIAAASTPITAAEVAILAGNINLGTSEVNGILPTTAGGTGLTGYNQGDIIYSDALNSLSRLAKNTSSTRYLSNTGTSNNPAWAQVDLSNGVTGTLPVGNGGTGATSLTSGGVLFGGGAGAFTASAVLTNGQLLIGDGTGAPTVATLTEGNYLDVTNGAGSITLALDPAEVGSVTWLDNADRSWTFDIASTGTNPVISFSNNTINVSTGTLQVGSTNVALASEVFVTVSNTSGLDNERALSASNYIDLTDAGANSILAISMDPTEVGSVTWGTADATWTFDATSGTNPTLSWTNSTVTIAPNLTVSGDLNAVVIEGANSKNLTESTPTGFVRVDVSAGSFVGGTIFYTIYANDGSNYQARIGSFNFGAVNESEDTETSDLGAVTDEALPLSAGTLTVAFTTDDSPTNGFNIQANAVSSLSQTTLQIKYRVIISSGTATVTAL